MMLTVPVDARCDAAGCGEALLFRWRRRADGTIEVEVKCHRCKRVVVKELIAD